MSLLTDKVFYNALKSNDDLVRALGDRIYSTAIPVPDEKYLNEPLPYCIIIFDGMQNEGYTKDNSFEGCQDKVQVSVEVVAESRDEVGSIMQTIRQTIIDYFEDTEGHIWDDYQYVPTNYTLQASSVAYDPQRPCYYQDLAYDCETNP